MDSPHRRLPPGHVGTSYGFCWPRRSSSCRRRFKVDSDEPRELAPPLSSPFSLPRPGASTEYILHQYLTLQQPQRRYVTPVIVLSPRLGALSGKRLRARTSAASSLRRARCVDIFTKTGDTQSDATDQACSKVFSSQFLN